MNNLKDKLHDKVREQVSVPIRWEHPDQILWQVRVQVTGLVFERVKESLQDTVDNSRER